MVYLELSGQSEGYVAWDEAATLMGRALAVSGFKAGIPNTSKHTLTKAQDSETFWWSLLKKTDSSL